MFCLTGWGRFARQGIPSAASSRTLQRSLEGRRVIQVQENSFLTRGHFVDFAGVRPNHLARSLLGRSREQLFVQPRGKDHWVAALTVKRGHDDRALRAIKLRDDLCHERLGDERVIDQEEHHSIGFARRQAPNRGLYRGKLAELPIGIDDDVRRVERERAADFSGVLAEDDARPANFRLLRHLEKMFEEGFAAGAELH